MSTKVRIKQSPSGFNIVTADEFEDELAGPFPSHEKAVSELQELADLDLEKITVTSTKLTVGSMKVGDLFRIAQNWYRLTEKNKATVIGENRIVELKTSDKVSELSVLCKK